MSAVPLIDTNRTQANQSAPDLSHLAPLLFQCANKMAQPMWRTTEQLRVFMPFFPGQYDQCTDKTDEIVSRLIRIAIPSAPITFPLGILSCIPRYLGTCLQKENFVHLKGNLESNSFSKREFTVFSMNICGLPGVLPLFYGGVNPLHSRISQVVQKIWNANADIVLLQEAHDEDSAFELYERLKDKYSDFYFNIGTRAATLNSGLFVCSKGKTFNPSFFSFKDIEGAQQSVNKGCFHFTIGSEEAPIAHIFHAHLHPSPDDLNPTPAEQKTRQLELQHILGKMQSITWGDRFPSVPVILAGDMNIAYGTEEYKNSILSKKFITSYDKDPVKETCTLLLSDYVWTYSSEKRRKLEKDRCVVLDYIVVLKQDQKQCKVKTSLHENFSESFPHLAISDHHAILSKITSKNRN